MRYSKACPGLLQELAFMPATRQAQETDCLPANQLGFGGKLETDSGGTGLLRHHPVAAAFGLLIFSFLRFGGDIILLGSRGRRGGGLLSTTGGRFGRAGGGGAGIVLVARGCGAEGDGARLVRSVTNRGHDANIAVVIAVFLLRAEGNKQRPGGPLPGYRRRRSRTQRHGGDHILDEACLNVDDAGPLG
jgi:hypothetical protein